MSNITVSESAVRLSDDDLLRKLTNFEDPFVERKAESDLKDCLKTAVAFANSLPVGVPGVLFVPAKNDGTIQVGCNLDNLQRTISREINKAYPAIQFMPKIIGSGNQQVIAVLIWGSHDRPHFSGPSYIRDGSQTKIATEKEFEELIAKRQAKVTEILKWKGKQITIENVRQSSPVVGRSGGSGEAILQDCNQFFVTLKSSSDSFRAVTLSRIEISYDYARHRLLLEISS